jgi:hypothetical protein
MRRADKGDRRAVYAARHFFLAVAVTNDRQFPMADITVPSRTPARRGGAREAGPTRIASLSCHWFVGVERQRLRKAALQKVPFGLSRDSLEVAENRQIVAHATPEPV